MPRAKKDGQYLNVKIDRELYLKFEALAEERGQTKTKCLERILEEHFRQVEEAKYKQK